MAALEFLSQPLWQRLTFTLLHFVWQGALLALVLAICLTWARKATTRYTLALATLLALVACPLATGLWLEAPLASELVHDLAGATSGGATELALAEPSWLAALQPYLLLTWLVGVCLLSCRLLVSYLSVRRLRAKTAPLDPTVLLIARRLARVLKVSHQVQVKASHYVREALVVGLWRPMVLMPASWVTELTPQVLEAVLAHELAHIRRHDLWINLVQRIVETLLFYHPAVWYVSRILRVEREKCCDELAVAATGQKVVYVEALELVARRRLAESPSVWAAAMGGTRTMNLLDRVRNVLGLSPSTSSARYWPVGVAALVVPAGLWCASLAIAPTAQAQEEKKDGDKPEARLEGDRPDRPRAEGERRDGDRPEAGVRRGGDRPAGPREGGDRPTPRREGDRPEAGNREGGDRPRPEPDRPRPEGDRPRDGERPPIPPELMRLIAELREEVGMLRREVRELRAGRGPSAGPDRGPGPGPMGREGGREGGRPEADRPRPDVERPREGDRPRPLGERVREGGPRAEGDRPRPMERRPDGPPREGDRRPDPAPRREGDRPDGAPRRESDRLPTPN